MGGRVLKTTRHRFHQLVVVRTARRNRSMGAQAYIKARRLRKLVNMLELDRRAAW